MKLKSKYYAVSIILLQMALPVAAEPLKPASMFPWLLVITTIFIVLVSLILWTALKIRSTLTRHFLKKDVSSFVKLNLQELNDEEIDILLDARKNKNKLARSSSLKKVSLLFGGIIVTHPILAAPISGSGTTLLSQPGIIITLVLILIPLFLLVLFLIFKINKVIIRYHAKEKEREAAQLADYLLHLEEQEIEPLLLKRKASLQYRLSNTELAGIIVPEDRKGIIQRPTNDTGIHFVATKKKALKRPNIDPQFSSLILWFLGTAIFWLVFGTTVGEYLGIKFVSPDVDHVSWLSFGRLRPVHTNAVFWGWSSLAMIGLGHYVVSVVSNTPIASLRKGWIALLLINASVIIGTIFLMAGINNGGGEYREYVWPVMALFGAGLIITLINFIQTIAKRTTHEIYISNWYIVSAIIFTVVIAFIAYWPTWQNGLGETIVQGYYMHQGVGMWFMLFSLGIVYYFLPQQLNKPIYSYSLGILAFWTQILFYTLIGTHHFVFSSIPWWLQTVAIVGSMGMLIPVTAGTTNFVMTFKGDWSKIGNSYTLPFYAVGIVFYFTGSFQGTAEAFRYTNLLWHFTDFTVAHSHITMYGIVAFLLWGSIYALVPRLTGSEPPQLMVGAHFWLAFIGLLFYSIPLMIGGTLKGLMWMDGKPFMDSVKMMAPYWLWRAIGGSLMWLSHLFFAYNFYRLIVPKKEVDMKTIAFEKIKEAQVKNEAFLYN
ncbi:cbb3-type cytochrome c oxidase subunit I [Chryseolinea sp. H1M3-3]|uniref:cbb3-type cytochrome c oxidase subunit I n=1 Tax=Chryseolinea sp. H1M3-3 TaxID=3034144 RepID=UPI0023EAC0D1|nr:cbb3-type cytochrome c oxidase subunit I [Chryseolinea sp. H1M3-3]